MEQGATPAKAGIALRRIRLAGMVRFKRELTELQGYWSRRAKEKGRLTERDLRRYL